MKHLSLRVRLTALIGVLLTVLGATLLAVSYGLVDASLKRPLPAGVPAVGGTSGGPREAPGSQPRRSTAQGQLQPNRSHPPSADATQRRLAKRTRHDLVKQYLLVLALVLVVAVSLGWLLAGRMLRSVRRLAAVAGRVGASNLQERVQLRGPRDELRDLADAFDAMLARLDVVFSAQRRFVADAAHELRTPLAAMRAEVELIAADPQAAAGDVEAAMQVLQRQLARSEELIEALLALARSEPELLASETIDLAQIARESADAAAARAAARSIRIDAQLAPVVIDADRRLVRLLVTNLLDNAIKHNDDEGWVLVRTAADRNDALLVVANSGPVVSSDEIDHLTQAFRRGGQARTGDGHGLGLAIVAAVARAHRADLTIEPLKEGGLRIELGFPCVPEPIWR